MNRAILTLLLVSTAIVAQDPRPHFEVASIKAAVPKPPAPGEDAGRRGGNGGCPPRGTFAMDRSRVDIGCANLEILMAYAFRVPPDRVVGPEWITGTKFDVVATLPAGASQNQAPEMLQALLIGRFQLAVHRGTRQESAYALTVAKGGLKVKEAATPADATASPDGSIVTVGAIPTVRVALADGSYTLTNPRIGTVRITNGPDHTYRWQAASMTFAGLADLLNNGVGFIPGAVDMTGSSGRYQLDLEVSLRDAFAAAANTPMDIQDALVKSFNTGLAKLGLQLDRRRADIETVVVDHVEKVPSGN